MKKKNPFNKPAEKKLPSPDDPKGRLEHFRQQRGLDKPKEDLKAREEYFRKRRGGGKTPKQP